jgi:hypothetical protein
MRVFAVWTSLATILILNVVIGLGLLAPGDARLYDPRLITLHGALLTTLHVVLPISSVLMMALLAKEGHRTRAALFAAIVAGMLVVVTLRVTGPRLSRGVHLVTDLCVLNVYLIALPWHRTNLPRRGQTNRPSN